MSEWHHGEREKVEKDKRKRGITTQTEIAPVGCGRKHVHLYYFAFLGAQHGVDKSFFFLVGDFFQDATKRWDA